MSRDVIHGSTASPPPPKEETSKAEAELQARLKSMQEDRDYWRERYQRSSKELKEMTYWVMDNINAFRLSPEDREKWAFVQALRKAAAETEKE